MDMRVERLDFGRLDKTKRTPNGFVKAPAYLTRTGVFTYTRADGTKTRELRHPEEVFKADSLATLSGTPVTDMHPSEFVSPKNWKNYAVGTVSENIKQDGRYVAAEVTIQDANVIDAIEAGKRQEISCGYSCTLDETPGVFEGEHYDAIQRAIQYNHAALGPKDWGRAGSDVKLRLDALGAIQDKMMILDIKREIKTMRKIKIDGKEYTIDDEAHALADAISALESSRDTLSGRCDAQDKELSDLKAELAQQKDPKQLDAVVAARVALVTNARTIVGDEVKLDGLNERDIMKATLQHENPDLKLDESSDDYIAGRFAHLIETRGGASKREDYKESPVSRFRREVGDHRREDNDITHDKDDITDPYEAFMRARRRDAEAWKQPLNG